MISFVWSAKYPFLSGAGGSENYTAGQIRELQRRGIPCRIITLGFGTKDGRADFPDIPFLSVSSKEALSELDDTLVFVTYPLAVRTKRPAYVVLHCPTPQFMQGDDLFDPAGIKGKRIITPSRFALKLWSRYYITNVTRSNILQTSIVRPFADKVFGQVERPPYRSKKLRLLFPGRLTADKGIYTLLAALWLGPMQKLDFTLTVTTAGSHTPEGAEIAAMLAHHPRVRLVPARRTPEAMAELLAEQDIVLIPSTDIFWRETFGMASVEAQHVGCRVVASHGGGLPETDCGSLLTVQPDNPMALAKGIARIAKLPPVSEAQRARAARKFTVEQSVDSLLRTIGSTARQPGTRPKSAPLVPLPQLASQLAALGPRLQQQVQPAEQAAANVPYLRKSL
jgi:glycosyltransferase involved in cell wall biosynthesis